MSAVGGWFGDTLLTNGALYRTCRAPRGWLRLRLLNGCNARSPILPQLGDKRLLYVVASDGGLLAEPVKVDELPVWMGERFEVLVDTSDGKPFDLVTLPVSQMGMAIAPLINHSRYCASSRWSFPPPASCWILWSLSRRYRP